MFEKALNDWMEAREAGRKQGFKRGFELGIQQAKLQDERQALVEYVEIQFPELTSLARKITEQINDYDELRSMKIALYKAEVMEKGLLILLGDQS